MPSASRSRGGDGLRPLYTWRSAIVESDLKPVVRHVALTMSLHMNERGGSCFPKTATVIEETGLARSTVIGAQRELEDGGWLVKVKGGNGRGDRVEWEARIPPDFVPRLERVRETDPSDDRSPGEHPPERVRDTGPSGTETVRHPDPFDDLKGPAHGQEGSGSRTERVRVANPPPHPPLVGLHEGAREDLAPAAPVARLERRDLLFEAVVEAWTGQQWPVPITDRSRGTVNAVMADLRSVGATPDDVHRRARNYHALYDKRPTPAALAKHWPSLDATPAPRLNRGGNATMAAGARWLENRRTS